MALTAAGLGPQNLDGGTQEAYMRGVVTVLSIATALLLAPVANAATVNLTATLSGANETPPNASPGTGTVNVALDLTAETISIATSFSGLSSLDSAAHIHCCIAGAVPNTFVVATAVPAFSGFPLGVTSGTYSHTFSLTDAAFYNPSFVTAEGGTVVLAEAAFIAGLLSGQSYFNIHTAAFPGGEIRGQLNVVPIPGALPLFATGLGALGLLSWRRKRKAAASA